MIKRSDNILEAFEKLAFSSAISARTKQAFNPNISLNDITRQIKFRNQEKNLQNAQNARNLIVKNKLPNVRSPQQRRSVNWANTQIKRNF